MKKILFISILIIFNLSIFGQIGTINHIDTITVDPENKPSIFTINQNTKYVLQSSDPLISIPDASEALFLLNSITGDNMIDAINGWEFPITGKNWEDDEWSTELTTLHWKSGATISAPADGTPAATAIQAVDSDNFWYQGDGTPNQIPVQAFFQNINFSNLYFCRHIEQVLDETTSEELYPAGVADICMYKTVREDLTDYITYFGSDVVRPTENCMFVSKSGNDDTGDGSWATPYLTLTKALSVVTDGDSIYVLSGSYRETDGSHDYLYSTRQIITTFIGTGNCELVSDDATYLYDHHQYSSTKYINWKHFSFNGESTVKTMTNLANIKATSHTMLRFMDAVYTVQIPALIENCYSNGIIYGNSTEINNCMAKQYNVSTGSNQVLYSKVISSTAQGLRVDGNLLSLTVKYCTFDITGYSGITIRTIDAATQDVNLIIQRNLFLVRGTNPAPAIDIQPDDLNPSGSNYLIPLIQYNKIYDSTANTGSSTGIYGISAQGQANLWNGGEISHNYFYSDKTDSRVTISINPSYAVGIWKINYNRIFSDTFTGYIITFAESIGIGNEGSEIIGNYLRGHLYNYPEETTATTHGILASGGKNYIIKYNYVEYCALAYVIKAGEGEQYTDGGFFYNIGFNNIAHCYWRRAGSIKCYNNTFVQTDIYLTRWAAMDDQGYTGSCRGTEWKNNIFSNLATNKPNKSFTIDPDGLDGVDDIIFDNNIFENPNETSFVNDFDVTTYTYTQAVSNGWVVNGGLDNPVFTNKTSGILTLESGSPGIDDGTDLGASYDDGLDETTEWNNDPDVEDVDNYPSIVTKQQTGTWDKGAYTK